MAVTAESYRQVLAAAEALPPPPDVSDLSALDSAEQLVAFMYREFCSEGDVESALDWVEMLIRSADFDAPRVRKIEKTLRPLGFVQLANWLKQIAGKRRRSLRPL
jgi:hypothetical protein